MGGLFLADRLSCLFGGLGVYANWLCFSNLVALRGKNPIFRAFVFMEVAALRAFPLLGQNVTVFLPSQRLYF
jgi:hypothetical protein